MRPLDLTALLAATLLLAAGSTLVAYQELRAFAQGGLTTETRFDALRDSQIALGISSLSGRLAMTTCSEAVLGSYGFSRSPQERRAVQQDCLLLAEAEARRQAGASSYAHLVAAVSSSSLGDLDGFERHMTAASATAPQSAWLALQRVPITEVWLDTIGPDLAARHAEDLQLLVGSSSGIDYVAQRYVGDAGFRDRIVPLVEVMPDPDQARFVTAARRAAEAPRP